MRDAGGRPLILTFSPGGGEGTVAGHPVGPGKAMSGLTFEGLYSLLAPALSSFGEERGTKSAASVIAGALIPIDLFGQSLLTSAATGEKEPSRALRRPVQGLGNQGPLGFVRLC